MDNRLKLGILLNFSSKWMGGIIYIINLVKTLDFLDENKKPEVLLFYNPQLNKFLGEFTYPYLHMIEYNFTSTWKGYVKSILLRKNVFITDIIEKYQLNTVFPVRDFPVKYRGDVKIISWSPDLQNKHFPEFFSKKVMFGRNIRMKFRLRNCDDMVVSSRSVLNDFKRFYRLRKSLNFHIFHFVSVIDNLEDSSINDLKAKYKLPAKYYMVSNQFHNHKNHKVVLLSLAVLKEKGLIKNIAVTGRFPDSSDSPYMAELHSIIEKYNLHNQISFLGVIPRNDQLLLMKHSEAIIQPSLFEGWSTVIEDAKSLQVPVIASNLDVNIEQLGSEGVYFDPYSSEDLASILADYPERDMDKVYYDDYNKRIKEAAEVLLEIFS